MGLEDASFFSFEEELKEIDRLYVKMLALSSPIQFAKFLLAFLDEDVNRDLQERLVCHSKEFIEEVHYHFLSGFEPDTPSYFDILRNENYSLT